jgi:hypothetical protein
MDWVKRAKNLKRPRRILTKHWIQRSQFQPGWQKNLGIIHPVTSFLLQ